MKSPITSSSVTSRMRPHRSAWPVILGLAFSGCWLVHQPLLASEMDERIDSAAKKSYVFKTFLSGDSIKVESKNGVVSLTGTVSEDSHRLLAQETVAGLPGVTRVDNQINPNSEVGVRSIGSPHVLLDLTRFFTSNFGVRVQSKAATHAFNYRSSVTT